MTNNKNSAPPRLAISTPEFVILAAMLTCMTALSIDIILPVLPGIAADLDIGDPNDRQFVVTSYLAGLVVGQLVVGVASDRLGRLPVLYGGLALFIFGALVAATADSFPALLLARVFQGMGGAAPRILVVAIVRDLFAGRAMARIMSFVMTVFIMVPVFAPSIGQLLAALGGWRTPIYFLALMGATVMAWSWARLPETAPRRVDEDMKTSVLGRAGQAFAAVARSRQSVGYICANGFMFACLMGYILSSQQIFVDVYGLGDAFPLAFGAIAAAMAAAGLANARIVVGYGMRFVSHRALAAFVAISLINAVIAVAYDGHPPFWLLWSGLWLCFFFFALVVSNFNALAMEPLGAVAGTASSVMGAYTTFAGAGLGAVAGQFFDMTTLPLSLSFVLYSVSALATVVVIEGWRGLGREPETQAA